MRSFSEEFTVISSAWARNSVVDTGSSGGGDALLIILASFVLLGFGYAAYKRWRRRTPGRDGDAHSDRPAPRQNARKSGQ
jgi:hypothetical protein